MITTAEIRERYGAPIAAAAEEVASTGTLRQRITWGLLEAPQYAFGLMTAADLARFFGHDRLTVIEFGVADGRGLRWMVEHSESVSAETGIQFDVLGFDRGDGLPPIRDYRDHPEIWTEGDFAMGEATGLRESLDGRAEIIVGDVRETVPWFVRERLAASSPIGLVSIDLDLYSSSAAAMEILAVADPLLLAPAVIVHLDDIYGRPHRLSALFRHRFAGQLLALDEFNLGHDLRKIDQIHNLDLRLPLYREMWPRCMHVCHVLDHPRRREHHRTAPVSMKEHTLLDDYQWRTR